MVTNTTNLPRDEYPFRDSRTNCQQFVTSNLPGASNLSSIIVDEGASLVRRTESCLRIWDHFCATVLKDDNFNITMEHVTAYMLYRVGSALPDDPFSGSIRLTTFMGPELYCLHKGWSRRVGSSVPSLESIRKDPLLVNATRQVARMLGETKDSVHARPIWHQDEQRLLDCTSRDTMGLQHRAIIRVMLGTGGRVCDISQLRLGIDVREHLEHNGANCIRIVVPNKKRSQQHVAIRIIKGDAAEDIRKWLNRRMEIFPGSNRLFVSNKGTPITAESVDAWLNTLCIHAGYGERFFSAHSFRHGFASRICARILSEGKGIAEAYRELSHCGMWKLNSTAMTRYCDMSIQHLFVEDKLTLEGFNNLSPAYMHGVEKLNGKSRTPLAWFCHDPSRIARVINFLDGQAYQAFSSERGSLNQYAARKWIGMKLAQKDPDFKAWVLQNHPSALSGKDVRGAYSTVVALLLERGLLDEQFRFSDLVIEQKKDILDDFNSIEDSKPSRLPVSTNARLVTRAEISNEAELEQMKKILVRKRFDKRTIIADMKGENRLVKVGRGQMSTREVQFVLQTDGGEEREHTCPIQTPSRSLVNPGFGLIPIVEERRPPTNLDYENLKRTESLIRRSRIALAINENACSRCARSGHSATFCQSEVVYRNEDRCQKCGSPGKETCKECEEIRVRCTRCKADDHIAAVCSQRN